MSIVGDRLERNKLCEEVEHLACHEEDSEVRHLTREFERGMRLTLEAML